MTTLMFTGPDGRQLQVGPGRPWGVKGLEGWEALPQLTSSTVRRPGTHGSFAGAHALEYRRVLARLVYRPWNGSFDDAIEELRAVTGVTRDTPLTALDITQRGRTKRAWVRCVHRLVPQEDEWIAERVMAAEIEWLAADPFVYVLPARGPVETAPSIPGLGGLVFPLVFPLVFGTMSTGGSLTMTNAGNAPSNPRLQLDGPGRGFTITDSATGRQLRFDANFTLLAGDQLEINTQERAVTLRGVSQSSALLVRQWPEIPPNGSLTLTLAGSDMTSTTRLRAAEWYDTEA
jgi:hypothetical protein